MKKKKLKEKLNAAIHEIMRKSEEIKLLEEANFKYECSTNYQVQCATFINNEMRALKIIHNEEILYHAKITKSEKL